ncbi:hypothetical protein B0H19DRAFT_1261363 [Mycena capillaripes]|nr:hypothetical protein B0H19DRAFT_1261363 [Mycena capillaripes]
MRVLPRGAQTDIGPEDLAANEARLGNNFTYRLGDNFVQSQLDNQFDDGTILDDGITLVIHEIPRNPNLDRPLQTWYPMEDEYLAEQLRREGWGPPKVYAKCTGVWCNDPHRRCPNRECVGELVFRCVDQACFGEVMYCAGCIVGAHAHLPTHFVEKWTGRFFERKRTWLKDLGLRGDFVLYDLIGVHELNIDFCGCHPEVELRDQLQRACWWPATVIMPNTCATFAVLRLFQILNCLGKVSAYDFLLALEMCTNHDGLDKLPDRRKPFMHIVRQWRDVKWMKHFKQGHLPGGTRVTKQGELVLKCRQCLQPCLNLPEDWEKIDPFYRYIYFLFLAVDANFRLSNHNVSSEMTDPILGDGMGHFCKREGEAGYKAHIAKRVNDIEISSCSGFQAMFLANTRRVKGLRTTRANGIGDLQAGERDCNMDFLVISVLMTFSLLWFVVSYDIACQYAAHFWKRMLEFPAAMRLTIPEDRKPCHSPYLFHWMWGAGMTHGEGIEQNWSFSNGVAVSTRLMGLGSRHATLEDLFGFHNYDRTLAMHCVLPKWLAVSIKEGMKHRAAFEAFNGGLEALQPEEVAGWQAWVTRWESKQHTSAKDSPFELPEDKEVLTLRKIQQQIADKEFICTDDGVEVERDDSLGLFITMGLELEDVQRRLEVDVRALKDPTPTQKLRVYMPAGWAALTDVQKQMFDGNGEQLPEATRLFMPLEIQSAELHGSVCAIRLPEIEAQMRQAKAEEALEAVQQRLRTRTMTNRFRLHHYTGQGMMTKGQGILHQINIRIHIAKLRYRYACTALLTLRGHGNWEESLRVLKDEDSCGGAIIEGGIARVSGVASGEGAHTLSWIWYTVGVGAGADEKDPRFLDALRVEWCKVYSHTKQYAEDVRLLHEEMHRMIVFGYTAAAEWEVLADGELEGVSAELTTGWRVYAAERRTCQMLTEK